MPIGGRPTPFASSRHVSSLDRSTTAPTQAPPPAPETSSMGAASGATDQAPQRGSHLLAPFAPRLLSICLSFRDGQKLRHGLLCLTRQGSGSDARRRGRASGSGGGRPASPRRSCAVLTVAPIQKGEQQLAHPSGLLLLHPVSGTVDQDGRPHLRAGAVLHALDA